MSFRFDEIFNVVINKMKNVHKYLHPSLNHPTNESGIGKLDK